ncbi:MAG: helix-turn-helix domain-containing protein [Blautia wexlerae]
MGQKIGVNTSYLSDLFHKVEGTTIQQYIRKEKIRLAENMLRYSDYEIKEIASYLSFCSQSYFGKYFPAADGDDTCQIQKEIWKMERTKINDSLPKINDIISERSLLVYMHKQSKTGRKDDAF